MIWLFQPHDTIQMKSNYTWTNYNQDNIAISSHIMIYYCGWNSILVPNLVAFISQKEKNVCFFDCHLLNCSVRKMVLICLMQNIDMCLLYKSHQIACWYHTSSITFQNECLPCNKKMLLNLVSKMKFDISCSYGYIIVDSCIMSFNSNHVMQLKQFYYIATRVT